MKEEIWKDIKNYEGYYQISNTGRVKSLTRNILSESDKIKIRNESIMKPNDNGRGYLQVGLSKNGKRTYFKIHRLVAEAFIENPENKPEVNHIDGNKKNNRVDNLEWCTTKENCQHRQKNGLGNIEEVTKAKFKPVLKYNLQTGETIKEFESIKAAQISETGSEKGSIISNICHGKIKSYKGYGYKFK